MQNIYDAVAIVLTARSFQYRVLQNLFGSEPGWETLCEFVSLHTRSVFSVTLDENASRAVDAAWGAILQSMEEYGETFTKRAQAEYVRCFVGPGAPASPPWESMYVGSERTLFNAVTLDVRRAYASQGFRPQGYPRVADDHLAIELDFMACLAWESQVCFENGDYEKTRCLLVVQQQFLKEHLVRWVSPFALDVAKGMATCVFSHAATILATAVLADESLLGEMYEALDGLVENAK